MGRFLLILCTGALVVAALASGNVRRTTAEQDRRVNSFEADVVARENAMSALNQAVPFITTRFDSLLTGKTVQMEPLVGNVAASVTGSGQRDVLQCSSSTSRSTSTTTSSRWGGWWSWWGNRSSSSQNVSTQDVCAQFAGQTNVRILRGNTLSLTDTLVHTLMPTKSLDNGSSFDAAVRATRDGKLEVIGTGTAVVPGADGALVERTYTVRRTYAKVSAFDAAIIAVAPYTDPVFSGGFVVEGRDTDPSTLQLTRNGSRDRPGIKANTQRLAERFGAVLTSTRMNRVRGKRGNGDIAYGNVQPNLDAIFEEAFLSPSKTVLSDSLTTGTYGSAVSPVIAVRNGDLTISGTVRGTGILTVNGNLQTIGTGRLIWDGVVMVRRDAPDDVPATVVNADLAVTLGPSSVITGSLVTFQRSSAILMPFNARLKFRYVGSFGAGLFSSVGIQHTFEGQVNDQELVVPGANRAGDVEASYANDLRMGEQVNFYIGVYYPAFYATSSLANTLAYKNFARGHFDPVVAKPYGVSTQTGPYQWQMAFEDLREGLDIGFGPTPDWDYYDSTADQVIEVTLQCRQYDASGTLVTTLGVQQYEDCTPDNPDTHVSETPLTWSGITATSGQVAAPQPGTTLRLTLSGAHVYHSSLSIARLTPLLNTIRQNTQVVLIDSWTSR